MAEPNITIWQSVWDAHVYGDDVPLSPWLGQSSSKAIRVAAASTCTSWSQFLPVPPQIYPVDPNLCGQNWSITLHKLGSRGVSGGGTVFKKVDAFFEKNNRSRYIVMHAQYWLFFIFTSKHLKRWLSTFRGRFLSMIVDTFWNSAKYDKGIIQLVKSAMKNGSFRPKWTYVVLIKNLCRLGSCLSNTIITIPQHENRPLQVTGANIRPGLEYSFILRSTNEKHLDTSTGCKCDQSSYIIK